MTAALIVDLLFTVILPVVLLVVGGLALLASAREEIRKRTILAQRRLAAARPAR